MTDAAFTLFDEFAARFARGEALDVRDYLDRAGGDADALAAMIDAFLMRAEPVAPDEESVDLARALVAGHPPLLELRKRRGIRVDEIVETLVATLGIDTGKRSKVKRYYQELEGGLLDPGGVDSTVWGALASKLGGAARELAAWRPRPAEHLHVAFHRAHSVEGIALDASAGMGKLLQPDEDEVDRLFTGADRTPRPRN